MENIELFGYIQSSEEESNGDGGVKAGVECVALQRWGHSGLSMLLRGPASGAQQCGLDTATCYLPRHRLNHQPLQLPTRSIA